MKTVNAKSDHNDRERLLDEFRKRGVLAFCPVCGATKAGFRNKCRSCGYRPQNNYRGLAKSILMSTEQYYLRGEEWAHKTPAQNTDHIEKEIVPKLIAQASALRGGKTINFAPDEEDHWVRRFSAAKPQKPPKSLLLFLAVLYALVIGVAVFFLKHFFF